MPASRRHPPVTPARTAQDPSWRRVAQVHSFQPTDFLMRISTILFASLLAFPLALALTACSSDEPVDADPFDTLQACYDEHHGGDEHLPVQQAIATCCLDHPIAGMKAPTCLDSQPDCVAHVNAELDDSISAADIDAACTTYITEKQK
jgi:hypothetical protein